MAEQSLWWIWLKKKGPQCDSVQHGFKIQVSSTRSEDFLDHSLSSRLSRSWQVTQVTRPKASAFYRLNWMLPHPRPMFYPSGNVSNHRNTLAWKWQSTHEVFGWKEDQTEVMSKIHSPELSSVGTWKSRFPSSELPLLQLKLRIWKLCRSESQPVKKWQVPNMIFLICFKELSLTSNHPWYQVYDH